MIKQRIHALSFIRLLKAFALIYLLNLKFCSLMDLWGILHHILSTIGSMNLSYLNQHFLLPCRVVFLMPIKTLAWQKRGI